MLPVLGTFHYVHHLHPIKGETHTHEKHELVYCLRGNGSVELEGEEGLAHLEEYCDGTTERGKNLRCAMAENLHLGSLDFQSLQGVIEAIGIEPCKLCTYCWNGKE